MKTMTFKKISWTVIGSGLATLAFAQNPNLPPLTPTTPNSQNTPAQATSAQGVTGQNLPERIISALTTQQFVTDAAMGGMKEVQASKIALEKSQNRDVRNLATRMVADHTSASTKLQVIAHSKGLDLPPANTFAADDPNWNNPVLTGSQVAKGAYQLTTNLSVPDYQDIKHLNNLSGAEFDIAYAKDMVSDHILAVREFETAQRNLTDPEIRQFATETLPTLRSHSAMAQNLENQLTATPASTAQTGYENGNGNVQPKTTGREAVPPSSSDTPK
jgi:putative membrane protein